LGKIQVYDNIKDALEGTTHWCATTMPNAMALLSRPNWKFEAPRKHFQKLINEKSDIRIAFLFGNEHVGMREEGIRKCHAVLGIPTNPLNRFCHYSNLVMIHLFIPSHTTSIPSNLDL
jgi:tRNA/rRNA methyltransferase